MCSPVLESFTQRFELFCMTGLLLASPHIYAIRVGNQQNERRRSYRSSGRVFSRLNLEEQENCCAHGNNLIRMRTVYVPFYTNVFLKPNIRADVSRLDYGLSRTIGYGSTTPARVSVQYGTRNHQHVEPLTQDEARCLFLVLRRGTPIIGC